MGVGRLMREKGSGEVVLGKRGGQEALRARAGLAFEAAGAAALGSFDAHSAGVAGEPIYGAGAFVCAEGFEGPIAIGGHTQSVGAENDGELLRFAQSRGSFGAFKQAGRVFEKAIHRFLIVAARRNVSLFNAGSGPRRRRAVGR